MAEKRFRPNVAAVVRNRAGLLLICERSDFPGCWQFPQGGINDGESPEDALRRELQEEVSLRPDHYVITARTGPYRYEFPGGLRKKGCDGQEQTYFLADLQGPDSLVSVATESPEFTAVRWVSPERFDPAWAPPMKRPVYRAVFRDFFGITLPA